MLGLPSGWRTWIWTIAAPALAASIDEAAICSGVTGIAGCLPTESAAPVIAQVLMTSLAMETSLSGALTRTKRGLYRSASNDRLPQPPLLHKAADVRARRPLASPRSFKERWMPYSDAFEPLSPVGPAPFKRNETAKIPLRNRKTPITLDDIEAMSLKVRNWG